MATNNFFERQTALTNAKTKIYKEYITGYLPKLLMHFNECTITDLFCGPGKNGKNNGSPIILIEQLNYLLTSATIRAIKDLKVTIYLNDENTVYINDLNKEISKIQYDSRIINIVVLNSKYEDILNRILSNRRLSNKPIFFFLDPFTYSDVSLLHLQKIMRNNYSEILLFTPLFDSYRFSGTNKFEENHKTRKYIEEFTSEGMTDYENVNIYMKSIKEKLLNSIKVNKQDSRPYIRPVLIDGGGRKNALFLITSHQKGMLLMNKILLKNTDEGSTIHTKNIGQTDLFEIEESSSHYENFRENLVTEIQNKGSVTNSQIVDFSIREEYTPKHAKAILVDLHKENKIIITDLKNNVITSNMKWNIAENISKTIIIKYLQ